jgi:hypothetical protein
MLEISEGRRVAEQAHRQLPPDEAHLRSTTSHELEEGVIYLQPDCSDRPPCGQQGRRYYLRSHDTGRQEDLA